MKRILCMILAFVLVLGLLPATAFAADGDLVYISISEEGQFINDPNGEPMAYRGVSLDALTSVDLNDYDLSDYIYDSDGDGVQDITALHLYIYVHEQILGLDFSDVDCSNGSPASMYFSGGLFGYEDENLRYNYNGAYPANEEGWGFTADNIVLSAGDFLDVAHYSDWNFYTDAAYGFHHFTDADRNICYDYTAQAGEEFSVKLLLVGGGMGMGDAERFEADYTVYYGNAIGQAEGSVETNVEGVAAITFPDAGTWYIWCDGGEGEDAAMGSIVSSPTSAKVTVTAKPEPTETEPAETEPSETEPEDETPRSPQSVSSVINATMAKLAATVTEPSFGTNAGEWTVLCLARGGYYAKDNAYFTDYYNRIVETVNTTAAKVNLSGALHKSKSTDNSRLIVALSSIGKNATSVGDWDLAEAYSANGLTWIKKQGLNGPIWALIALDTNNYETSDTTLRQQCVDYILSMEMEGGGWKLNAAATTLDVDITGMTLQALYPYRDQPAVAAAAERAFTALSNAQLETGGFMYGTAETSESAAQVIVACATWGINPDTDSRFVKSGKSVVDNLLSYYIADEAMFAHQGTSSNNMATDQACYALIAYDRLVNGKTALYDMSDVTFDQVPGDGDTEEPENPDTPNEEDGLVINATLGLPAEVENAVGTAFNAIISIDNWDNTAKLKLIDFLMAVPQGLKVTGVTAGDRLFGGSVSYHMDENGDLRCVYFDANENSDLTVSGTEFPAEVFTVSFEIAEEVSAESLTVSIEGMSVKLHSDSSDENAMIIVNTAPVTDPDDPEGGTTGGGSGSIGVVTGISFSAVELYRGDDVDLLPSTKKAVAVAVTGIDWFSTLVYNDGTNNLQFQYSDQITSKTNIPTYVALVDSEMAMTGFINKAYFTINGEGVDQNNITFGDSNSDGVVNAQDALAVVDAWLRKGDVPADSMILRMNVNGDSRINTFDALGIVEAYVNGSTYGVVTKAATIATKQ